jgi:hypothetical protein
VCHFLPCFDIIKSVPYSYTQTCQCSIDNIVHCHVCASFCHDIVSTSVRQGSSLRRRLTSTSTSFYTWFFIINTFHLSHILNTSSFIHCTLRCHVCTSFNHTIVPNNDRQGFSKFKLWRASSYMHKPCFTLLPIINTTRLYPTHFKCHLVIHCTFRFYIYQSDNRHVVCSMMTTMVWIRRGAREM